MDPFSGWSVGAVAVVGHGPYGRGHLARIESLGYDGLGNPVAYVHWVNSGGFTLVFLSHLEVAR